MRSAAPSVLVLTAPRSGSSWFASLLRSTGQLGLCREWLTSLVYPGAHHHFPHPGPDRANREEFVSSLRRTCSTENGVAAVKIIGSTLDALPGILAGWGIGDGVSDAWVTDLFPDPVVLVLRRCDRIGRAISWWRATSTGQYAQPKDDSAKVPWPDYDFAALEKAIADTTEHARRVDAAALHLANAGVHMIDAPYESLMSDPAPVVRAIAELVGVRLPPDVSLTTDFTIQRDDMTDRVRERLLLDLAAKAARSRVAADAS